MTFSDSAIRAVIKTPLLKRYFTYNQFRLYKLFFLLIASCITATEFVKMAVSAFPKFSWRRIQTPDQLVLLEEPTVTVLAKKFFTYIKTSKSLLHTVR